MGINEYDELRGENIALRREAEELRAQLEIAHGALDEAERAIAAASEEGRAAGYGEGIEKAATLMDVRAQALMRLGGVHVREAVGIGETAILVRALAPATTDEP